MRERRRELKQTQKRSPHKDGGKTLERCSFKSRNTGSHGKLGEARKDPPLETSESVSLLTP